MGCLTPRRLVVLGLMLVVGWILAGCSKPPEEPQATEALSTDVSVVQEAQPLETEDLTRVDRQGAVEFAVTPLDMQGGSELRFEISMNTHSVDLSMDVSELATLETDLGASYPALSWSGGSGHHVQGVLVFPGATAEGDPLLSGAREITLRIRDIDAPERVFTWEVGVN